VIEIRDSAATEVHSAPAGAGESRHIVSLDGLRAIAVTMVMLFHANAPGMSLGFLGVDLFFCLSGFLITSLLLREHSVRGRVSLPRFWARRFLRLMPAYWFYAAGATVAMLALRLGWTEVVDGWTPRLLMASIWGYFVNYAPKTGIWEYQLNLSMLWSLAVEEQFYLLWPAMLAFLLRRPAWAERVAWGLVAAILMRRHFASDDEIIFRLDARGLGIMMGCATALSLDRALSPRLLDRLGSPIFRASMLGGLAAIIAVATVLKELGQLDLAAVYRYVVPLVCPPMVAVIAMLWYGPGDRLAGILSWRPLAYVGKISYGVYLYHMLAQLITWTFLLPGIEYWPKWPKFGLRVSVYLAISIVLASASYYTIERPFLKLKGRMRRA
jgi:peptidoglycan/LPS O-acetylase OafA/YrhL